MRACLEKRNCLRLPIDCSSSCTSFDDHREHSGTVINLSSRGVLYTSRQRVEAGIPLDIVPAAANPKTPPTPARAEVVRVTCHLQLYEIACRFGESRR